MKTRVSNRLAEIRKSRGVSASDLARRVNVSRQTIYAIEAGTYVPNTEVALHLSRELEVPVEDMFSLSAESQETPKSLAADVLSAAAPAKDQPVRICQVGSRWIAIPVSASPYYLPEADGVVKRTGRTRGRSDLAIFAREERDRRNAWCWQAATRPPVFWPEWWKRSAAWRSSPPPPPVNWRSPG